jgi:hypothetical protein
MATGIGVQGLEAHGPREVGAGEKRQSTKPLVPWDEPPGEEKSKNPPKMSKIKLKLLTSL